MTTQPVPLSLQQKRLWFLHQVYPQLLAYNIPFAVWLEGEVHQHALEHSLKRILERHESLRLRCTSDGMARYDLDFSNFRLAVTDARSVPVGDRDADVDSYLTAQAREPFDLAKGPLFRFLLLRLATKRYVFAFTFHHLIFDGWSIGVLLKEISEGYRAHIEGSEPALPDLPVQYKDYVRWQLERLNSAPIRESMAFWKRQLSGHLPHLDAMVDRHRPLLTGHQGARLEARLSATTVEALKELCRSHRATLFVGLLASYAVVLHRYSDEADILIGGPVAGRNRTEHEHLIGYLVNTVVYRINLEGDPSFDALLKHTREVVMQTLAHMDAPFDQVVSELALPRDLSRHPLFQFAITYRNMPNEELQLPGARSRLERCEARTAKFDMTLFLTMEQDTVGVQLEYNDELFSAERADAVLKSFLCAIDSAIADPSCTISRLPWLDREARHRVLVSWNDTQRDYPRDKCVHELFETQAEEDPHATALVFEKQRMSYQQLNARANQLATYLKTLGVGPETIVGLCVERSMEMVVGILGILKAGGAYLPLDPEYPQKRLEFMLEDTAAPVVLTQHHLRARMSTGERHVVCLDSDRGEFADIEPTNPHAKLTASNLAYVIYTSGSTGQPKGVCIEHRGVVRLVTCPNYVELGPKEVFLQFAPLAFDASTFEIWGSLLNGAKLVVASPSMLSLSELSALIRRHRVSTLWLTATLFQQMVETELETLRGVRQILAGGETLPFAHTRQMIEALPTGHRLVNGYGPTENTTFTTCHVMTETSRIENSVPIGRPIPNTRVYVLDTHMQPVPAGVTGDLYIGGDGLAREYLHQPELTWRKFVDDPFDQTRGARLYSTGDRVRYTKDGVLEYVGRNDYQVKLRGHRIELGEIERVLAQYSAIKEVVVVLHHGINQDKQLVAYVSPSSGSASANELRMSLSEQLPSYMVPSAYVFLDALPRNANGKIARELLPVPDAPSQDDEHEDTEPHTALERGIAEIWCERLALDSVRCNDSFFELGGHSLLVTQVLSRIKDRFGVDMSYQVFFADPTVSGVARSILGERLPPAVLEASLDELEHMSEENAAQRLTRLKGESPSPADE